MRTTSIVRWVPAVAAVAACAWGCDASNHPSLEREPLAKGVPVAPAAGPSGDEGKRDESAKPKDAAKKDPPEARAESPKDDAPSEPADEPEAPQAKRPEKKRVSSAETGSDATGLSLKRLVVTTAIEHREPVATSTFRAGDGPIIAFVELANPGDADNSISIGFESDSGRKVGDVELEVPAHSRRWRTWGRTRLIRQPGAWTAVVKDGSGEVLARQTFVVTK
jgi:hypothetical protein